MAESTQSEERRCLQKSGGSNAVLSSSPLRCLTTPQQCLIAVGQRHPPTETVRKDDEARLERGSAGGVRRVGHDESTA